MRVFKNKVLKRIASLLLLLGFFILLDVGMGELLSPPTYATCFNHDVAAIEREGGADIVFVGASRVYRTFVPQVFEDVLGVRCVVNAGSSTQPICGTYWELKDLVERLHPKRVFIGVTWDQLTKAPELQARLIVIDRLSLKNRLQMSASCFGLSEMSYLLDTYRFKDNFVTNRIRANIMEKRKLAASNYAVFDKKSEYYADTGFVHGGKSFAQGNIPVKSTPTFSEEKIKPENVAYLDACVRLCKDRGIDVALVSGVTTVMRMYAIRRYQAAVDWFTAYARDQQIPYYNLNYLVGREDFLPDDMMYDNNHTNGKGAREVSERFAQILKREDAGEDVSSCFYPNLDAMKRDVRRIVSVRADIAPAAGGGLHYATSLFSLQNDDVRPLYRLLGRQWEKSEFGLLQDWTPETNLDFTLPAPGAWTLRVEAGAADPSMGIAFQEYPLAKISTRKAPAKVEEE